MSTTTATVNFGEIDIDIDIDTDSIVDEVVDQVLRDMPVDEIADQVVDSYGFSHAVEDAVVSILSEQVDAAVGAVLDNYDFADLDSTIAALTERVATLEAALAAAAGSLNEPARRQIS